MENPFEIELLSEQDRLDVLSSLPEVEKELLLLQLSQIKKLRELDTEKKGSGLLLIPQTVFALKFDDTGEYFTVKKQQRDYVCFYVNEEVAKQEATLIQQESGRRTTIVQVCPTYLSYDWGLLISDSDEAKEFSIKKFQAARTSVALGLR